MKRKAYDTNFFKLGITGCNDFICLLAKELIIFFPYIKETELSLFQLILFDPYTGTTNSLSTADKLRYTVSI